MSFSVWHWLVLFFVIFCFWIVIRILKDIFNRD